MKPLPVLLLLFCCTCVSAFGQPEADRARVRREKLEAILRIQDRRTTHDGKLISLLGDADPFIRERATLAYASIQDSTALPLLLARLDDRDPQVQEAAAFAVGQTALVVAARRRASLEKELIWKNLPDSRAPDRLLEEIGKFGTDEGLTDIMIRVGNVYPGQYPDGLALCIARFAIRGITTPDAIRYLLRRTRPPEETSWHIAYALQRIGDHPDIRNDLEQLVQLRQHADPLVRMSLASLLGKVQEPRITLEPLRRLAEFDGDWRVRVNALKSLALYPLANDPTSLLIFRRAFYDPDVQIAATALSAVRTSNLIAADTAGEAGELFRHLRTLAYNARGSYPWPVQSEAAQSIAAILRNDAFPDGLPAFSSRRHLDADLLRAAGAIGSPEILPVLLDAARGHDPVRVCGALDGLGSHARRHAADSSALARVRSAVLQTLASDDVAVVGTAAGLLADSLFPSPEVVPALIEALGRQRLPDGLEAVQEITSALGNLGDPRAVLPLLEQLKSSNRSVAVAAAHALTRLTSTDYLSRLPAGTEPFYTDFDFAFLWSLPETLLVSIETARGTIRSEWYRDAAPFTVMALVKLARQRGFYRGLTFHRVVPNFVTQGGCPRGDGWGGPGFELRSEFSLLRYEEGTIGIASAGKDTEGSQFFVTHSPQPHLDGRYTIIGRVTEGMGVVRALQRDDRIFDVNIEGVR